MNSLFGGSTIQGIEMRLGCFLEVQPGRIFFCIQKAAVVVINYEGAQSKVG